MIWLSCGFLGKNSRIYWVYCNGELENPPQHFVPWFSHETSSIEDWNQLATFDYRVNHHEIWTIAIFHGKLGKLPFLLTKNTPFSNFVLAKERSLRTPRALWQCFDHPPRRSDKFLDKAPSKTLKSWNMENMDLWKYIVYFLQVSSLFSALSIYYVLVWFIYILST